MDTNTLFTLALGLQAPWEVKNLRFEAGTRRLDIDLDFTRGASFPCQVCGLPCKVHDTEEKSWRHLDFFQHSAYLMKLTLQDFYEQPNPKAARHFLSEWCQMALDSTLEPMAKVAKTFLEHAEGVLRWFRSGLSNGLLEGINSLIQAAKSKARGYRTSRNLIAVAYLIAGKLQFKLEPL
jgi:hypothetical protein